MSSRSPIDVAAYIWPSYHHEPRLAHWWDEGDGEWYTVRRAKARWPGHDMPKHPLLGFQDEADPVVMKQHVQMALDHGINVFIMDWYWYDGAPCFERQLNEGVLPAVEGTDMKFCLMWANHDATSLWNPFTDADDFLYSASVDRAGFEEIWTRNLASYLSHPNYYCIDGKPVISVFLVQRLAKDLGGPAATADAFNWLREKAVEAGLPGVHWQAIHWQTVPHEAGALMADDLASIVNQCGYDSCTNYQMVQCAPNHGEYVQFAGAAIKWWDQCDGNVPNFFPHVSIGWDNTHRQPSESKAVTGRDPWSFEAALIKAKMYLEARPDRHPLVTINSWNEWTEDSYLLPDLRWGYGYLDAVKRVFGSKSK